MAEIALAPLDNEPLGPEDAFGRKPDDIEESFVDVGALTATGSLPRNAVDVKVLVGRKGSGKTHILRHLENQSRNSGRVVSLETLDENFLSDRSLVQLRGTLDTANAVTMWTSCWRVAVAAAALSHFTCRRPNGRAAVALRDLDTTTEELSVQFGPCIFDVYEPMGPVSALKKFLARHKTLTSAQNVFRELDFSALETEIGRLLHAYGDIHFLIDGLDEFAWIEPRSWLEPQLGLFKLVFMQKVTRSNIRRVHLTITLRNYVFSHALRDTHQDRIQIGAGVVPLIWDFDAANTFLNQRLAQISGLPFARSHLLTGQRPLARWLGFEEFTPERRGKPEPVEYYLLRHTRCSPRHIIQMFTRLCQKQNVRSLKGTCLDPLDFEDVIREQSRKIASSTLRNTAEELLSFVQLDHEALENRAQRTAMQVFYVEVMERALGEAISACGTEIVSRRVLRENLGIALTDIVLTKGADDFVDLAEDALWRSGVMAYSARERGAPIWRYTWSEHEIGLSRVPDHVQSVGFHPALVTSCNLEVSSDGPVF